MNKYNFNNELLLLLEKFINEKWNYIYLSPNPNITMKDIKEKPSRFWNYGYISKNPNITMEYVEENYDKGFDFKKLSKNNFNLNPYVRNKLLKNRLKFTSDDLLKCIEDIKYRP